MAWAWIRAYRLVAVAAAAAAVGAPRVARLEAQPGYGYELTVVDADSLRVPTAPYVGNQACRQCHAGIYPNWIGNGHARAYVFLATANGYAVAERMGVDSSLVTTSVRCLVCHSTAADVEAQSRPTGFRMQEGVKCEGCHGPGGLHVRRGLLLSRELVAASRMRIPVEEDCLACHRKEPAHDILELAPFDYEAAVDKISHAESRAEKMALLRRQPGFVIGSLFQRLLFRWYSITEWDT